MWAEIRRCHGLFSRKTRILGNRNCDDAISLYGDRFKNRNCCPIVVQMFRGRRFWAFHRARVTLLKYSSAGRGTSVSDLGLKKYGGISRQIHKLNKYIRYFFLCWCQKSFWKMWGIPGKNGGKKPIPPPLDQTLVPSHFEELPHSCIVWNYIWQTTHTHTQKKKSWIDWITFALKVAI